jgi:UDP-N-acetylglucosamine 2-epimerase (non-hydrolysing)
LVTLHRPSNVDEKDNIKSIVQLLKELSKKIKIVFPIHPRTIENFKKYEGLASLNSKVVFTEPLGYIDFLCLQKNAQLVLTDSGGIQEESTFLGVQCVTMRENTERPITVEMGTNHLAGKEIKNVQTKILSILSGQRKHGKIPELWDGKAAERIVKCLADLL